MVANKNYKLFFHYPIQFDTFVAYAVHVTYFDTVLDSGFDRYQLGMSMTSTYNRTMPAIFSCIVLCN